MSTSDLSLTPAQAAVVDHRDGPLLVLAGPGSGKTRVITRRIVRLIETGVPPRNILAITFTNKATDEMRRRVEALLPGTHVWVSTFHRFCARLLRRHAPVVGLQPNFTILDAADQKHLIRGLLSEADLDPVAYSPERIAARISEAKNCLLDAEAYVQRFNESVGDHWQAVVARIYPAYQQRLKASNSVDFDDLLLHCATMLMEHPELRAELDERFRYVLVDEYQDTNQAQYQIVAALSQDYPNLCVTGDPDQSIYGWRGARIENILRFEREFPQARVIRLEENFRSTKAILRSAARLISHNRLRKVKDLTTGNPEGDPVELLCFRDEFHEADGVAAQIRTLADAGRDWSDFAICMRVNTLSRHLERALRRYRIPYQVAAGAAFFDRTEVKDLLAYLRLVLNPADRAAFLRVVNTPARGLGETSRRRLLKWADEQRLNPLEASARAAEVPQLSRRAAAGFRAFAGLIAEFSLADAGSVAGLLTRIIDRTGYTRPWEGSTDERDLECLANVQELVTAAREFDDELGAETSLEAFLERSALVSDTDTLDPERGKVTLMTLHAAKGLEFPIVFIVGLEQGLIPHERAIRDASPAEFEEERRLLFVGMTRARNRLFLTQALERTTRGRSMRTVPSDFLSELECTTVYAQNAAPVAAWTTPAQPDTQAAERERKADAPPRPLLTTAADLLRGGRTQVQLPQGFACGAQVRHPQYGIGTVIEVGGFGTHRTVTVQFRDSDRTQKFVASQSPLQPIGS